MTDTARPVVCVCACQHVHVGLWVCTGNADFLVEGTINDRPAWFGMCTPCATLSLMVRRAADQARQTE